MRLLIKIQNSNLIRKRRNSIDKFVFLLAIYGIKNILKECEGFHFMKEKKTPPQKVSNGKI